jgi:hypothetical protein
MGRVKVRQLKICEKLLAFWPVFMKMVVEEY